MVVRILTAVAGAAVITTGLLLGMHEVTKHFDETDPMQYFGIADFIPAPDGPRRPTPIKAPEATPDRPELRYESQGEAGISVEAPSVDQAPVTPSAPRPSALLPPAEPDAAEPATD